MSDGRFSSKPIRSGLPREKADTEFTADPRYLNDDARAFLQSNLMRDEINAIADHALPEILATVKSAPLHKSTPAAARDLGRPLASAVLVQEYLIGLIFLRVCGWIFIFFGGLFLVGAVVMAIQGVFRPNPAGESLIGPAFGIAFFGFLIGGAGAWFGFFRGRVIEEMCWFCPRGMIWMSGAYFDWYTWDEVREIYSHLLTARPAIGIRLESNLSVISFSNTPASRRLVDYIEHQASAACAQIVLEQIAEGRSVRFGDCRLSRSAFRDADTEIAWQNILDLQVNERELRIRRLDGSDVAVSLDEIPFPRMFVALARGIHAYSRHG